MSTVLANSNVLFFILIVMWSSSVCLWLILYNSCVIFFSLPKYVSDSKILRELLGWALELGFGKTIKKSGFFFVLFTFLKHRCINLGTVG